MSGRCCNELTARRDVTCLLLTGNTAAGARAKLAHYGLDEYFERGAFCGDGDDRLGIARAALELANGTGTPLDLFVIGDTPHDIRCGEAIGARTVAVASGGYSLGELEDCGPWLALERLPEPGRFAQLLGLDESD